MKIQEFKKELTTAFKKICLEEGWAFDNPKQRGMAFENWCFNLFAERYPSAENDPEECIIRGDDAGLDVVFESKETDEIYILQCKHPKIAASDPIPEEELKSFFSMFTLLKDRTYLDIRNTVNPKIQELAVEYEYWNKQNFLIHFIFISSGTATEKTSALVEKFNRDHQNQNVKFDVWDVTTLRDEYAAIKSVEEQYPSEVSISIGQAVDLACPCSQRI